VANFWVGPGQNQPVSHNQLGPAPGPDINKTLAQRSDLSEEELTKQLSQVLPGVADKLPPAGRLPTLVYLKQCEELDLVVRSVMRLDKLPTSDRIEDRRGIPGGRAGLGIGTVVILGLIGWALGIDPRVLIGDAERMSQNGQTQQQTDAGGATGAPSDEMGHFVSAILGSTEAEWTEIFARAGRTYKPPTLVMFSGATQSGCGFAKAAMGPFYCPIDQKVYLDTSFFQDLERRFRACDVGSKSCQFSEAYVIAHEIGHHVQNQLGLLPKVQEAQRGMEKAEANSLQVRVELQADCLAGVWANRAQTKWQFIEPGDVEAALQTASAIGDDRLQRQTQGYVVPDAFTHGTSAQRTRWFLTGLKSGDPASCDTLRTEQL